MWLLSKELAQAKKSAARIFTVIAFPFGAV